jgi:hypothetical protein
MLRSTVFTILLGIVLFVAKQYYQATWVHPAWVYMLIFFLSVSFLNHRLMDIGFQNNREKFVEFYLGTIVARLLLCAGFAGFFMARHVEQVKVFVLNFLVLYIFYLIFEIYSLGRKLRRDL